MLQVPLNSIIHWGRQCLSSSEQKIYFRKSGKFHGMNQSVFPLGPALTDLLYLQPMSILRAYISSLRVSTDVCNIYVYSDTSTKAYGAVVYICKNNQTSLVMSKSHVAFIKSIMLLKLQLIATIMATWLAQFVISSMKSLQCYNPPCITHLWTDSQIVLYWICKNSNL